MKMRQEKKLGAIDEALRLLTEKIEPLEQTMQQWVALLKEDERLMNELLERVAALQVTVNEIETITGQGD